MSEIRKKEYLNKNVYEMSLERINYLYDRFDNIVVNFSGGKDSTAVLNLTIEVAKKRNKLPVKVVFFDEEAIHPPTIEYVKRVRERKDVDLEWYCLPVKHRNACSNEQPFWFCWNPDEKDLWIREMPEFAIKEHPKFKLGLSFQEFSDRMHPVEMGTVCMLVGIRTQESLRRFRAICSKKNDNFITSKADFKNTYKASPIYDWSSEDVWRAVSKFNWDYNKTYDVFNKTKLFGKYLTQRVCPPYGEEPLRGLWIYSQCFPEMWHKMLYRVKGVATAWRYGNTELYSVGLKNKPKGMTWREYLQVCLQSYNEPEKSTIQNSINLAIKQHYNKTNDKIEDEEPNVVSGCSWKFLCKIVIKGDFKGRTVQNMMNNSLSKNKKANITYEDIKKLKKTTSK